MAKTKLIKSQPKEMLPPALDPEERDNQVIAAAVSLAERQILEGTASSQVITHYLKLAANREKMALEREKLRYEMKLLETKTRAYEQQKLTEERYNQVLEAMRSYSGTKD